MDYRLDLAAARTFGADILNVPPDGQTVSLDCGGKLLLSHGRNHGVIAANNSLAFHHALYNALPPNRGPSSGGSTCFAGWTSVQGAKV